MLNRFISRWALPFVILALLWGGIAKWNAASWVVGLPCILFALVAFDRLRDERDERKARLRIAILPGFAVWFLWNSLRGGADVAWRALQPRVPLNPGFLRYRLALRPGPARLFLVNCVSLLPGTLSADIEGDFLVLHALDAGANVMGETREAERRVQALYGIAERAARG